MLRKIRDYADLLKLEHTIFALPFGLASIVILMENLPDMQKLFYIVLALIFARLAGMAFNRFLDREFDAQNPRTASWPHARGTVKSWEMKLLILLFCGLFILVSAKINKLALLLSPVVILLLFLYPLAKRFTYYPHLFLGVIYLLIPIAVDIALNEKITSESVLLGFAMAMWVSGFDILYSLQDYEFDKRMGLKSIPVRFGIKGALRIARSFHFLTFLSLFTLGLVHPFNKTIYFLGLLALSAFLVYEHTLISEKDLSKINKAFFTVNGFISIIFFFVVLASRAL